VAGKFSQRSQREKFSRNTWGKCMACNGAGLIKPMIITNPSYTCAACTSIGWIPPDGKQLTEHEALRMMRFMLNAQTRRIRSLRIALDNTMRADRNDKAAEFYEKDGITKPNWRGD